MKVRAIKAGFYAGVRRDEGETFVVKDGAQSKWFAPVESAPAVKPKGRGKAPETFAEIAHTDAATVAPEGGGGDSI